MNWFDVAALALILLTIFDGWSSGFGWAILETCMLFGTAVAAKALRPLAEPYVLKVANLPADELPWVTHLVVFAFAGCSFYGLLLLLHPVTKKWRFPKDKWAGAAVGIVNGLLASILIGAIVMASTPQTYDAELRDSVTMQAAAAVWKSGAGAPFLPDHVPVRAVQLWGE
jgi:hypothetical protein